MESETEKMRATLLRAVSHDLRTPLTGIIGNSSLFLESQNDLSSTEQRTIMTNIYEDSNWLLNMVENLLSVTRIQGDSLSINTTEEPVEEVVGEALEKLKKRYPDAAIRVKIPEEFLMIPMDAVLIEQVTINLLENAIVHSGSILPIDFIVEDHPACLFYCERLRKRIVGRKITESVRDGHLQQFPEFGFPQGYGYRPVHLQDHHHRPSRNAEWQESCGWRGILFHTSQGGS